ncbi:phage tail tape measure protein [Paragemmobacter aquarius]|uniref:phage tail tape measure protein n=1 Tax=Paragemmobacter aquarius TaxID=2169400 RepID=UPI001C1F6739|nr:phage tail tape measure protein [Gemmobacter aquarius]
MSEGAGADERLVVMLEARIAEFEKRMQQAERRGTRTYTGLRNSSSRATREMERDAARAAASVNQSMASISGRIGAFGQAFVGGLIAGGLAATLSQIGSAAATAVKQMADLVDVADAVAMSTDDFQGLVQGMGLAGVATEEAESGLKNFVDRLGDAQKGSGALYEVLKRNNIALTDQAGNLRPTVDLLRDFAGLVKDAPDQAARMALTTDAFGKAGKNMTLAFADGAEGLDAMKQAAIEGGYVIEEDLLRRAAELDDKFDMLATRLGNVFKVGVVEAATFFGLVDREARAAAEFVPDQAARVIGEELTAQLAALEDVQEGTKVQLESLIAEYQALGAEARLLVPALAEGATMMRGLGNEAAAVVLTDLAAEMSDAAQAFADGKITGEEYAAKLERIATETGDAISKMSELDQARLAGVSGAVSGLLDWIKQIPAAAQEAAAEIRTIEGLGTGPAFESGGRGSAPPAIVVQEAGPNTPRPRRAPSDIDAGLPDTPKRSGGGGGGDNTSSRVAALVADLETERELLSAWYEESQALLTQATDKQLEAIGGRHEALERLEVEHQERLRAIRSNGDEGALANAESFFGSMATLTAAGGNKMVKATQIFGAAEALINTYRAQAQVLADPSVPFFGKFAAAAAIGAAGFRMVAAIKGGGGGGGGGSGGGRGSSSGGSSSSQSEAAPLRARLEGIDPAKLYEGGALLELVTAIQKEAGNRGIVWETGR